MAVYVNDLLLAPHEMDRATQVGPFVSKRSSYSFSLAKVSVPCGQFPFRYRFYFRFVEVLLIRSKIIAPNLTFNKVNVKLLLKFTAASLGTIPAHTYNSTF